MIRFFHITRARCTQSGIFTWRTMPLASDSAVQPSLIDEEMKFQMINPTAKNGRKSRMG